MRRALLAVLPALLVIADTANAIGLTPNATRMDVIKYTAIFIVSCLIMFLLLIRGGLVPFLVRNYYPLSEAQQIGISLFLLYALILFTLLFFRYLYPTGWKLLFFFIALVWLAHLVFKVLLGGRRQEE
ncbi:MAG: hypothetical protein RMM17_06720 [Acidobacteriota bacterium]|nr:hypothetical protein [Blastocatellia bacterium]MDW8412356.1 hypothetical protein [Acidobacteriota bacterium]